MEKYRTGSSFLAYDRVGPEGGIPLVFLHGATVDRISMKNTFERYFTGTGSGYQRIYLDLPGHGESGCPLFRTGVADMVDDIGAFLRGNFARPPCLVAYSMGGFLALKLAETIPFPTMFIIAPPVYTNKTRIARPHEMELFTDLLTDEERRGAEPRYLRLSAKRTSETLKSYRANLTPGYSPLRWFYQKRFFRDAMAADLTIDPAKIGSRMTFLVGQQDLLVGYRDQFDLSSKAKFSEYHSFCDCGHFLPFECAQFGDIFMNWLADAAAKSAGSVTAAVSAAGKSNEKTLGTEAGEDQRRGE